MSKLGEHDADVQNTENAIMAVNMAFGGLLVYLREERRQHSGDIFTLTMLCKSMLRVLMNNKDALSEKDVAFVEETSRRMKRLGLAEEDLDEPEAN